MDDELLRLADLKYHKLQEIIDREIRSKESNLISAWAAKGISGGPGIKAILDLNFEKAKTLYRKRIEIEKELFQNKYGYLPDPMMEQLKKTARGIIAREMRILSDHGFWKSHRFGLSIVLEKIREKKISLRLELDRDIEIEKGEDKLRLEKEKRKSLEEKKREQFLNENGNSLIETFKAIDDIDSFAAVSFYPANTISAKLPLENPEAEIKELLQRIIGDPFTRTDWGGEQNDIFSSRVILNGKRLLAAFFLKGPSVKGRLTLAKCGKNGDQIQRLFQSPADMFVVQFNGEIDERVIEECRQKVRHLRQTQNKNAVFTVIDGVDTARLIMAYGRK